MRVQWNWPSWLELNSHFLLSFCVYRKEASEPLEALARIGSVFYSSSDSRFFYRDYSALPGVTYNYAVSVRASDVLRGARFEGPLSELVRHEASLPLLRPEFIFVGFQPDDVETILPEYDGPFSVNIPNVFIPGVTNLVRYAFHDLPARAFRTPDGTIAITLANYWTYLLRGSSFDTEDLFIEADPVDPNVGAVYSSHHSQDPGAHRFREWISATYVNPYNQNEVLAVIHNEFQGHRIPGICESVDELGNTVPRTYGECWYNSLTLALSRDGGTTFRQPLLASDGLSQAFLAGVPYRYPDGGAGAPIGMFSGTNIFTGFDGKPYIMIHAQAYGEQLRGMCLARLDFTYFEGNIQSVELRAWDGDDFTVTFQNPYAVDDAELEHLEHVQVGEVVSPREILAMPQSVIRVEISGHRLDGRFVTVGVARSGVLGSSGPGIYYSVSQDPRFSAYPTRWGERQLLIPAFTTNQDASTWQPSDGNPLKYPSLIPHGSSSPNFDVATEPRVHLYYQEQLWVEAGEVRTLNRALKRQVLNLNRLR